MPIFQSSSGYGGLEASPLARIGYSDVILSRIFEEDWLNRITNSELIEPITRCNQVIQLMRAPEVGPIRSYQKNQQLVPNTITTDAVCLSICNAGYMDIKFDLTDIYMACNNWGPFEEKMLESMYQSYVSSQRDFVLGRMIAQTSLATSGSNAGLFHEINLGKTGAPVHITPQNLPLHIANLQRSLVEQKRWVDGQMFLIVPPVFKTYVGQSNFANASWVGDNCGACDMATNGMWNRPIYGFQVIETIHSIAAIDSGNLCYYIIAGNKDAFTYASNILEARLIKPDRYFGMEYQLLVAWGGEMIYPDAMAVGYWTFDPIV